MKYMLDFPGGYNYGFPRELSLKEWQYMQETPSDFREYVQEFGVPAYKIEQAWLWARWYKDDTKD